LLVLLFAGCLIKTDLIGSAFNGGVIDTSAGDPFRAPADVRADTVARLVKAELIDGYFAQGDHADAPHRVADWMDRAAADRTGFWERVVDLCTAEGAHFAPASGTSPGAAPADGGTPGPEAPPSSQGQVAREKVLTTASQWTDPPKQPICNGPNDRNDHALQHFADYVRFTNAVERAARAVAQVLIEGLIDKDAVERGAELAFRQVAHYIRHRGWHREIDRRTAGLVIKGGASTGIYSAGAVWVTLNVIFECMRDATCRAHQPDPRFSLISGTSTGAFVAAAVDRFNTASDDDRSAELARIPYWFTCVGMNEMYCIRSGFIANLASETSPQLGALEFDGLERILESEIRCDEMQNASELVLNTVDFRSGRLFSLSDQDVSELRTKHDVVEGVLASALLPLIGKPVARLPVSPGKEDATYLDGGIRSELPILPLVRRGAERVLVVSSAASILGETGRLRNALDIARRYIDLSTGGVTEGEMGHAQRQVESIRFAEMLACEGMLYRGGEASRAPMLRQLCEPPCRRHALCETRWTKEELCRPKQTESSAPSPSPRPSSRDEDDAQSLRPPVEHIASVWRMKGIFRDQEHVAETHGYDFNAPDQRRLFRAGAEAARLRCTEIADLLGIDYSPPNQRKKLAAWCSPVLRPVAEICGKMPPSTPGLRRCDSPSRSVDHRADAACR
jgi:predicted acylesterase/phospholipase RssA